MLQIFAGVIPDMEDTRLAIYIPQEGLRIALRLFLSKSGNSTDGKSKKDHLFQSLRVKLDAARMKRKHSLPSSRDTFLEDVGGASRMTASSNLKATRIIQIGWMNWDDIRKKFVQIRLAKGGGTRSLHALKNAQKKDVIEQAKAVFFPPGHFPLGSMRDYDLIWRILAVIQLQRTRLWTSCIVLGVWCTYECI